jgi:hypothetical protein
MGKPSSWVTAAISIVVDRRLAIALVILVLALPWK